MKVILLKNVPNLGEKNDVKEVATGYARNFLMPKGLVKEATPETIKEAELEKEKESNMAEADLAKTEKLAQQLEGQVVEVTAKASESGTLFASVSALKIAGALKDKGFSVQKEQIQAQHIKEIGEHEVVINLDHGLDSRITLIINAEWLWIVFYSIFQYLSIKAHRARWACRFLLKKNLTEKYAKIYFRHGWSDLRGG